MELPGTMELPKNIVQIGKPDPTHKIFVEDYVISYMKQWNKHGKRDTGIVLYGRRMTEGECRYYFVYGASYLPGVEARMQYLTDEEKEEAEEIRRKHFSEYELLGWGELRGELPEGFYMYEQNRGVWIKGYACFFEKNDSMLSFMVAEGTRKVEPQPTVIHKEISATAARETNIDARMEERNRKLEQLRMNQNLKPESVLQRQMIKEAQPKSWKNAAMVMALLVCVVAGLVLTDEEKRGSLTAMVSNVIPKTIVGEEASGENQVETLRAGVEEIAGTGIDALLEIAEQSSGQQEVESAVADTPVIGQTQTVQSETPPGDEVEMVQTSQEDTQSAEETQQGGGEVVEAGASDVSAQQEATAKYVSYTIMQGDTLLSICRKECGSEAFLQQVCQLNNIENADDIKIGQIILLPE